jgi:MFS family permease
MFSKQHSKIIALTSMGGLLEFYDFTIYALFAPYISAHFCAPSNHLTALMSTFAVFAVGYLIRPVGAVIFGHIGDKWGRKNAFTLAIVLMAVSTLLIGCLPGYETIGMVAPILLSLFRMIQGVSVAGEIPGATVFILEHTPAQQRGFVVAIILMFITLGNTLGGAVGLFLTSILDAESMRVWGWRIPFVLGFLLGIISYIIRSKASETPEFIAMKNAKATHAIPVVQLMRTACKPVFTGMLMIATPAALVSFFLYLPTYLSENLHYNMTSTYLVNFVSFFVFATLTTVAGWLSDKVGRRELLILSVVLSIPLDYMLFSGLLVYGERFIWVFTLGMASLAALFNGCYSVIVAESFPPAFRYSGFAISHGLALAIFGGLAPLGFTNLLQLLGDLKAPYYYLLICYLLSFSVARLYPAKTPNFSKALGNRTESALRSG